MVQWCRQYPQRAWPRHADDRRIFLETVHEEARHEAVASVRRGTFEQRAANAVATVRSKHWEPELSKIVAEGYVGYADERELIVLNREYRVTVEIDFIDVGGDTFWRDRPAEPQSLILGGQR